MDIKVILGPLISNAWFLIPLAIFAVVIKSAWFKGLAGEFLVNVFAKLFLNKEVYHLVKNVTLPTEDGSTQIDHIIVSKYGVFVVETKNMKGWIFGSEKQKTWTQKIFKSTHKFQNPLHQNYKHLKSLESTLAIDIGKLFSVVVFVGDSIFKTKVPENVVKGMAYIRYIKSKKTALLSDDEVSSVLEQIQSGRLTPSFKTNRAHVKHVKELVAEKGSAKASVAASDSASSSANACPKCGSDMVMRETKKGNNAGKQFWGCATFPKCRGVKAV